MNAVCLLYKLLLVDCSIRVGRPLRRLCRQILFLCMEQHSQCSILKNLKLEGTTTTQNLKFFTHHYFPAQVVHCCVIKVGMISRHWQTNRSSMSTVIQQLLM